MPDNSSANTNGPRFDGALAKDARLAFDPVDPRRRPETIAVAVGVSVGTLYQWEAGKRVPSIDEAHLLAEALGLDVDGLMREAS